MVLSLTCMITSEHLTENINRWPGGNVFTNVDFVTEMSRKEDIIKAPNRLSASGRIVNPAKWNIVEESINFNKS